ncbi:MAG: hypothetical protein ABSG31_03445 [Tepidisphaeraceae bacterium]|jgi:hypothetical protein
MSPHMRPPAQWISAAQRLRVVRSACTLFLDRWAAHEVVSAALDRVADGVERAAIEAAIADPHNRDWSLLYRGSILDD